MLMSVLNALPTRAESETPRPLRVEWHAIGIIALCIFLIIPILGILFGSMAPSEGSWDHLVSTVLWDYVLNTLGLLLIVAVLTSTMGTGAAWLVAVTDFPGRRIFEWLLVLPVAAPAYIIAYVYTDLLEFAGPVQTWIRDVTGWGASDYWFPPIRSLPGAGVMLALVLYPYVYLLARSSFLNQSRTRFAAARSLGASPLRAFWRVALPSAKAAILGGMALAMMETAADFGVADYFGVTTFSTGIYRAWYGLGDPVSSLRLAGLLLVIVAILLMIERSARNDSDAPAIARDSLSPPMKLGPVLSIGAMIGCAIPILFGFLIPVLRLIWLALEADGVRSVSQFVIFARNSFSLSIGTALIALLLALFLAYAQRSRTRADRLPVSVAATRLATLGYALPGTLLAVGLLLPLTSFDKILSSWVENQFGLGLGLILTGSGFALIYAYVIRFLTVAYNTVEPAVGAIPTSMDEAARTLGSRTWRIVSKVHFPGLRPALYSAALLVFIDTMRELPATLLLRPFNFETLATRVYRLASDERLAEASTAALALVVIGLIPVLLLNKVSKRH